MKINILFTGIAFITSIVSAQIEVTVATDKSTYQYGDSVEIFVVAYNPTSEPITLSWPDHCQFDYLIDGEPHITCIQVPSELTIESQSYHTWEWTDTEPLETGEHEIVGLVVNYGEPDTTYIYVQNPDYFPLEVGNEWTYEITYDYDIYIHYQTITNTEEDTLGNTFYELNSFDYFSTFNLPNFFRWDNSQVWGWFGPYYDTLEYNGTDSLNLPIFKFDAEVNDSWGVTLMSNLDSLDFFMVPMRLNSRTDSVVTSMGTFYNCYNFVIDFIYGDLWSFWFAEGVGLVKRYDFHEGSPDVEWVLQSTNLHNTTINDVLPSIIKLGPAYPNPFNPATTIQYTLKNSGDVKLQIFNIKGQLIESLVDNYQTPGSYLVNWKPKGLSSGQYFFQIIVDEQPVSTKKAIYLK